MGKFSNSSMKFLKVRKSSILYLHICTNKAENSMFYDYSRVCWDFSTWIFLNSLQRGKKSKAYRQVKKMLQNIQETGSRLVCDSLHLIHLFQASTPHWLFSVFCFEHTGWVKSVLGASCSSFFESCSRLQSWDTQKSQNHRKETSRSF